MPKMDQVFNMDLGLVLIISDYNASRVQQKLSDCGLENWEIGGVGEGGGEVFWSP